jgi:hypothetical protein
VTATSSDPESWLAILYELPGEDEHGAPLASGRVTGELRRYQPGRTDVYTWPRGESLPDTPLEEALSWAGERAARVIVRLSGVPAGYHSAGRLPASLAGMDLGPLPPVAAIGRRKRPAGWEFLDRTAADPPILWDVEVEIFSGSDLDVEAIAARWGEELSQDPTVTLLQCGRGPLDEASTGGSGWRAHPPLDACATLRVEARTMQEAIARAVAAGQAAGRWLAATPTVTSAFAAPSGSGIRRLQTSQPDG